jgi:hypothetical protein
LCTNHKPSTKSAVTEVRDVSVYKIVAIIEKTTFFKQYTALARLKRTAAYCLRLFHNAKNFVSPAKKQLQHQHDDEKLHNHLATIGIIWHFMLSAPYFGEKWKSAVKSMKIQLRNAALNFSPVMKGYRMIVKNRKVDLSAAAPQFLKKSKEAPFFTTSTNME